MDAETSPNFTAPAFEPYGVSPYVDRAVERIERHFKESRDAGRRGEAFVVGVFGEWGSGKSTVLDAIGARFTNQPKALTADSGGIAVRPEVTLRVDFNAWRFEREEHLLVPLLKMVERTLNEYLQALDRLRKQEEGAAQAEVKKVFTKSTWNWLAKRAQLLGACTIALTRMVKLKAGIPGLGEVELDPTAALEAAQKQIDRAAKLSNDVNANLDRPLESFYYDLFTHLRRLTRGVDDKDTGRLNFVFLIDDLDRCLPEKAVEMLEAIKLFLDVEGCAFVLALDDEIIERGIAHRYRDYLNLQTSGSTQPPITGHEYLEKIVQLPFRLPRWSRQEVREFVSTRFKDQLVAWGGFPAQPLVTSVTSETPDTWLLELIVKAVPPVPRNLVRAIELLDFTRSVVIERKLGERLQLYPVAQMVLLQLFAPNCFRFLRRGHAQGWKTFEKRLRKNIAEFAGESAGGEVTKALINQPASSSEEFFDWWFRFCDTRMTSSNADPYIGHTERPLAVMLDAARNNRNGFDPRNLMLTSDDFWVDESLEPYFSLFAESATATSSPSSSMKPQASSVDPVGKASEPVVAAAAMAAAAPALPPAPPLAPARAAPPPTEAPSTGTPRDREVFIRQLLSRSPDSWRDAINREEQLIGRTLDERTVDELIKLYQTMQDVEPRDTSWLELLGSLLTPIQMRRLVAETKFLNAWARKGELIGGGLGGGFNTLLPRRLGFARALEIACRYINPPHAPLPSMLQLPDLGLEGLHWHGGSPELAYRYVRGIEWPNAADTLPPASIVWAAEQGFLSEPTVAIEVAPGVIAAGDEFGVVRILSRGGRGRWECVDALRAHRALVSRLAVLNDGGFVSVGWDETIAVYSRDATGRWWCQRPKAASPRPGGALHAVCQLKDGAVIVGGQNGVCSELSQLPSREWQETPVPGDGIDIQGLAPFGTDGFCVVNRSGVRMCRRSGSTWSSVPLQLGSASATDVIEWEGGVAIVTESGEIAHVQPGDISDPATSAYKVSINRLSSSPFRRVYALREKSLATLSDDGRLRLWMSSDEGFVLRADFKVPAFPQVCVIPLCDGRVAFSDLHGVSIAAPDLAGVWRPDEVLAQLARGVTSIAAMSESLVAFAHGDSALVIAQIKDDDLTLEYLNSGLPGVTALAAIDANTLAVLEKDRLLRVYLRGPTGTWSQSTTQDFHGPVTQLAASNGRLVVITRNHPLMFECRAGELSEGPKMLDPVNGEISAVAIDKSGRVALATENDLLIWAALASTEIRPIPHRLPGGIAVLSWIEKNELLCIDRQGNCTRVRVDLDSTSRLSGMEPSEGIPLGAFSANGMLVRARGTAPVLVDPHFHINAIHADVKALVIAETRLFIGSDAFYVIDLNSLYGNPPGMVRRIVVREDCVLNAVLDMYGDLRSVHLRRTQGERWNIQTIGGRPVPDDPRLQACIGTIRANGQLGEITEMKNYVFNQDRTIFSMEIVG